MTLIKSETKKLFVSNPSYRKHNIPIDWVEMYIPDAETSNPMEDAIIRQEFASAITDALAKLTKRQKQVVEMILLNGDTQAEVARKLGVTPQSIHDTYALAIKSLRENPDLAQLWSDLAS
jgi:RNA polymerase sigma factor (sigma-70 family)